MDKIDKYNGLVVFQDKKIRRIWHNDKWFFSIIDIVSLLTNSSIPKRYWADLKLKLEDEGFEAYDKIVPLKLTAEDGKLRFTDCTETETLFRLIQSIPSPKAEPFKLWLSSVGYERVKEIENPELAQKRMKELYESKGYSEDWIEKRVRGIIIRDDLTEEWKKRGIEEDKDFAILTAEISKATFGLTPSDYLKLKGLKKENLRDHMNDLELIFTMLGERSTTEIARVKDSYGFMQNKVAAVKGGKIAGDARENLELATGRKVSTSENYLDAPEKKKRISKLNSNMSIN